MKSSSSNSSHRRPQEQEAHELISDITQLMAEAEEMLNESTSHHAEETVALFTLPPEPVAQRLLEKYVSAKDKFSELARRTDATIRARPYESVAMALGVGFVLGATLGRRFSARLAGPE